MFGAASEHSLKKMCALNAGILTNCFLVILHTTLRGKDALLYRIKRARSHGICVSNDLCGKTKRIIAD